jgi:hypothetical protein
MREMRVLQGVVAIACLVPLIAGSRGVLLGPGWIHGVGTVPADLDSHFRYMSGIFLGVGLAFVTCIPDIAAKGPRFRLLGALVVVGGFARLASLIAVGPPSPGHIFGLSMELGVVPLLMLWQARIAHLNGRALAFPQRRA